MKKSHLPLTVMLIFLLVASLALAALSSACQKPDQPTTTALPGETTTSESTAPATSETTSATTAATTLETTSMPTTSETTSVTPTTRGDIPAPEWSIVTTNKDYLANDGAKLMEATYALPHVTNTDSWPAFATINAFYDSLAAKERQHDDELAADAAQARVDLGENFYTWYDYWTGEVTWQTTFLASITVSEEYYSGGAHPDSQLTSVCFDLYTGLPMPLASFFTIPENDVIELLLAKIYQQTTTLTDESGTLLYDVSLDTLRTFFKPGNFYLTDKGFIIYYQPYDIAPYAAGLPEFLITYGELADVLRDGVLD
jgi:hypothetical protein